MSNHPATAGKQSPPRAPLAFRVGVVGHRPNRLGKADLVQLAEVLKSVLAMVKEEVLAMRSRAEVAWMFDDARPVVRAISPLAEGTDRIFAEAALANKYELCCVMPFSQAEFEKDFAVGHALEPDSLGRFRDLVGKAKFRFELDGCRAQQDEAYGAAGETTLNQSDLLVVVWDGQRLGKRGGTEETLRSAALQGVPVVLVEARDPHRWRVYDQSDVRAASQGRCSTSAYNDLAALQSCVRASLELPKPTPELKNSTSGVGHSKTEDSVHGLKQFYAEGQPCWTLAVFWKAFRDLVADGKRPRVEFRVAPFEESVKGDWPDGSTTTVGGIVQRLRPFYAWTDKLAVVYADRYRSAFILAFLLAAIAVGMALVPFGFQIPPHHWAETVFIVFELLAILVILGLVLASRRTHWHERWLNYRLAAELVRHLRLVAPLGGGRPFPQIPAHLVTYGQPASTWMAWYVRAVERALGIESAIVDRNHLRAGLDHLRKLVHGQIQFHEISAKRCRRMEKVLHRIGIALLLVTLAACVVHLLPGLWSDVHLPGRLPPLLTFVCGFFPALGAALAGIVNQGEFRRIAHRSESMHQYLRILESDIEDLDRRIETAADPSPEQFSIPAAKLASAASHLLLNEVLDWRVVFLDRPFEHPPA